MKRSTLFLVGIIILLLALIFLVVGIFVIPGFQRQQAQQSSTQTAGATGGQTPGATSSPLNTSGFPHVQGNSIVDANGKPLILRGALLDEVFNLVTPSGDSAMVMQDYPTVLNVMKQWHMNVLRLPTCHVLWQENPTGYISRLQTAVQQANAAGLYVVLDSHDDHRCEPHAIASDTIHLPRADLEGYWQAVATAFKNNPNVMYDVYNEPVITGTSRDAYTNADWQLWLNGGVRNGETFIGMQQLVNTIRATGSRQIIMVEGYSFAETFNNIGNNLVNDPDIVYEIHDYGLLKPLAQINTDFGFMLPRFPIFIGEWALIGGGNSGQTNCANVAPSQANAVVLNFLHYMAQNNISWTAYSFNPGHMVVDYTTFAPTTFDFNWTCGQSNPVPGIGEDVKQYLSTNGG